MVRGNPINNYDVAVTPRTTLHFSDAYEGERGKLTSISTRSTTMGHGEETVPQVKAMFSVSRDGSVAYPWYEGRIQSSSRHHTWASEHQSAVAYGNHYKNDTWGRIARDRAGLKWDFNHHPRERAASGGETASR